MKKILISTCLLLLTNVVSAAIPKSESSNFETQLEIANSSGHPMNARWQALLKAAEVANYKQLEEIKKFAHNKEWYMRNASLVALQKININHAIEEAKNLMTDKALVVRSASVDVLAQKFTRENRDLLAAELSKSYNFSRKQSLWIRPKIFQLISSRATIEDRGFLTKYLFDTDEKITKLAAANLEHVSDIHFEGKNQVNQWREYVKKNGWL